MLSPWLLFIKNETEQWVRGNQLIIMPIVIIIIIINGGLIRRGKFKKNTSHDKSIYGVPSISYPLLSLVTFGVSAFVIICEFNFGFVLFIWWWAVVVVVFFSGLNFNPTACISIFHDTARYRIHTIIIYNNSTKIAATQRNSSEMSLLVRHETRFGLCRHRFWLTEHT